MSQPTGEPNTAPPVTPPAPQGEPAPGAPAPQGEPAKPADNGPAGGKDAILAELKAEREARQKLEAQYAPLKDLAAALGAKPTGKGETDVEALTKQVAAMQADMAAANLRAVRAEVAAEAGLTPAQADRLRGSNREELVADAASLKTLFPATASPAANGPRPDRGQGSQGTGTDLAAALAAATEKKDTREAIRIKTAMAAQQRAQRGQ